MTFKQFIFASVATFCTVLIVQSTESKTASVQSTGSMPLPFTKNMGQWPDSILFRASANGATMWFTKNGIWYQFFRRVEKSNISAAALGDMWAAGVPPAPTVSDGNPPERWTIQPGERDSIETTMIKAEFAGANESVEVVGLEELDYKCNYFIGNEPSKWRTNVPNYSAVTLRGLYPGVDVTFSAKESMMQSQFTAVSEANLSQSKIEYFGATSISPKLDGSVAVQTALGEWSFNGILFAGVLASKSEQPISTASSSPSGLSLVYSTYLGGSSEEGRSHDGLGGGIAIDAEGNAYITGVTNSVNFPTENPLQASNGGLYDVFVSKISATGNAVIYSTYLGGNIDDQGDGIAIDTGGNVYVTGRTYSANFPTQSPFQASHGGQGDAFVAKLNSAGNGLIYSTYLGMEGSEHGFGVAVDAGGNAYVTGYTVSTNFPTLNPFQASHGVGFYDAFVTKFNSMGNGLIYSTYLGGSDTDNGYGIAVDTEGNANVIGYTFSVDFPTQNPIQASNAGRLDAFVAKLNTSGNTLIYSTYLGGSEHEYGDGIAIDGEGSAYVTGVTISANFPTQNPFQGTLVGGSLDAFVAKLDNAGNGLVYSTYLGGSGGDHSNGIAVDTGGHAYVTGVTASTNFPIWNPFQASLVGSLDAFVTKLNSAGNRLLFSTYFGGSGSDSGIGIVVGSGGNIYVMGYTFSSDFATQNPFQASLDGDGDVFVTKLNFVPCCIATRGNANGDVLDKINVVDITYLVAYLFKGGAAPACNEEADVNGNGSINVVDITYLVNYLFKGGPSPSACP